VSTSPLLDERAPRHPPAARRRRVTGSPSILARGEPMLWLTGGSLVVCITMIVGLLGWVAWSGLPTFWPGPVAQVTTHDGRVLLGELNREDEYALDEQSLSALLPAVRDSAQRWMAENDGRLRRELLRTGNYELFNTHFDWVGRHEVAAESRPEWAVVVERTEWGRFYGTPSAFVVTHPVLADRKAEDYDPAAALAEAQQRLRELVPADGAGLGVVAERRVAGKRREVLIAPDEIASGDRVKAVAEIWRGPGVAWEQFLAHHDEVRARVAEVEALREHEIGAVNARLEDERLRLRETMLDHPPGAAWETAYEELRHARRDPDPSLVAVAQRRLEAVERDLGRPDPVLAAVLVEVEAAEARANAEFETLAARIEAIEREAQRKRLWLDTSRPGFDRGIPLAEIVRAYPGNQLELAERIAIFLARWWEFFSDDPREANAEGGIFPAIFGTVLMTLIMCLAVVPFGVLASLYLREYAKAGPIISMVRIAVNNLAGVPSIVFGVFGLGFFCYIVGASIDELFYAARLPAPTFGKGGLIWASLTLALMTAPVVIVATEEALAAVPNSMREGSYACGASKWQTIRRIVLPRAMPGIMTGAILAMARGAGEVAPLMLVGAVKLAPELPFDFAPPFGTNRSFMHLGFHVYDLGFQSQNSEAAKSLVYTTTLLLIGTIALLNFTAIRLRARLRRRFVSAAF
jgi:phosphate ABC transporter permease subunit PstA